MSELTRSPEWQALVQHAKGLARIPLAALFEQDAGRADRFSAAAAGITLDYSRNRLTNRTRDLLLALAHASQLDLWIARLFAGETINTTEKRPALHTALRAGDHEGSPAAPGEIGGMVADALELMRQFSEALRQGGWPGHSGRPVTDLVALGIGGSHLGPLLVCRALHHLAVATPRIHFLANADGRSLDALLGRLDPAATLFLVVSKSFSTPETLLNAQAAREWYLAGGGSPAELSRHFIAITANPDAVRSAGFDLRAMLPMWDWVGGRYSLWSAVGLPIAVAIGFERFGELLAGANAMDEHFRSAPGTSNLPIVLALTEIWNVNFQGHASRAVIPYADALAELPAYLEQLEMESNGKSVDRDGLPVDYATAPVVWGATGTPAQHAVFQALHQGTTVVPVDFIGVRDHGTARNAHSRMLHANMLAQAAALMLGRSAAAREQVLRRAGHSEDEAARLARHQAHPGDRPSNTILLDELSPRTLGALIALYEHKVFVEAMIWRINPFDQWGVEWGKRLAGEIDAALAGKSAPNGAAGQGAPVDPATAAGIARLKR
jgi:glucose-6-phosphate isomerase